ncbi:50S ribosomal protein L14, partial [Dysosmobacter welbionis]
GVLGWGGSVPAAVRCRPCLLRVCLVVTPLAQAHEVAVLVGQLRILIYVLDVMDHHRRAVAAIAPAPHAAVIVTPQDGRTLAPPALAGIVKAHDLPPCPNLTRPGAWPGLSPPGKQKNARATIH